MGQTSSVQSDVPRSHEELVSELANKFAEKCFTSIELYSLKNNFRGLAEGERHGRYIRENTIARFLELPDVLGVSPVVFRILSYLGAFPFPQDGPAALGLQQLIMVMTLLTGRYGRVLADSAVHRRKLLFRSMAVYDGETTTCGPVVDEDVEREREREREMERKESEVDELVLAAVAALECLDDVRLAEHGILSSINDAVILADDFRKLIMLLLLVAPLGAQEKVSSYSDRVTGSNLDKLRAVADCVLASFLDVEQSPGIRFDRFDAVVAAAMPLLFHGFEALFDRFLFSESAQSEERSHRQAAPPSLPPESTLSDEDGPIMNVHILSQLSFFLPGAPASLFASLRPLYSGGEDGFSMGSFESRVFHWRAPSILLVRGTLLADETAHGSGSGESGLFAHLPPKRFPSGSKGETVTYGLYMVQPWQYTHRDCLAGDDTILFQLEPVQDVFRASRLNRDQVGVTKPSSLSSSSGMPTGITCGCPPASASRSYRPTAHLTLGPVSLVLDSSFEHGCFTHDADARGGGAFGNSAFRTGNFQDRFAVTSLDVWGCGGEEEARNQAKGRAWEAREAEARRRVNLGTGDREADRALLELAGLVGGNRSGGSMA